MPALGEAEQAYAEALAMPLGAGEVAEDAQAAVARLSEELQAANQAVGEALARYRPFFEDEALGPVARTRAGDLLDAHAARVGAVRLPLPRDMREQLAEASPDIRAEVERVFDEGIGEAMARRAGRLYCLAMQHYRAAGTERARAQLARYGASFVSRCPTEGERAPPD
ncbi:MAG TPA: hypothetical protein RMH99_08360 [Sandaracinaceae bacterium LLY-WYZ-13_1]|nr:hypothetical protein [Sandaracinaceae bacterium LLY-WYZ-13_1]